VKSHDATSTNGWLWFALLAGPIAWSIHELVSYAFVKVACQTGVVLILHLVTLATLALVGAGVYVALREYRPRIEPPRSTAELLFAISVLVNILFAFAIVMEGLPNLVVSPCL